MVLVLGSVPREPAGKTYCQRQSAAACGVLPVEGVGEVDAAESVGEVLFVEFSDVDEVVAETLTAGIGQQGGSVFLAFAVSDGDRCRDRSRRPGFCSRRHSRIRIPVP